MKCLPLQKETNNLKRFGGEKTYDSFYGQCFADNTKKHVKADPFCKPQVRTNK